jgi:hypothetical protein
MPEKVKMRGEIQARLLAWHPPMQSQNSLLSIWNGETSIRRPISPILSSSNAVSSDLAIKPKPRSAGSRRRIEAPDRGARLKAESVAALKGNTHAQKNYLDREERYRKEGRPKLAASFVQSCGRGDRCCPVFDGSCPNLNRAVS